MAKSRTQRDNKPAKRSGKASKTMPEHKPAEAPQRPGGKLGVIVDRLTESGARPQTSLPRPRGGRGIRCSGR